LAVDGNVTLYYDSRLVANSLKADFVEVLAGAEMDIGGYPYDGTAFVNHLRLAPDSTVYSTRVPLQIGTLLQLEPSYNIWCSDNNYYTAGSWSDPPTPEEIESSICPYDPEAYSTLWNSHEPVQLCQVSMHVCEAQAHPGDYTASWLFDGYFMQNPGCFFGPQGDDLTSSSYDWNQKCA
jgi:hypothetical protein